jgi:hypothetical protein
VLFISKGYRGATVRLQICGLRPKTVTIHVTPAVTVSCGTWRRCFHNSTKFFEAGNGVLEGTHAVSFTLTILDVEQLGRVAAKDGGALCQ